MEALRARIRLDPDDAVAWSIYADWLSEEGDPRGAQIASGYRGIGGPDASPVSEPLALSSLQQRPLPDGIGDGLPSQTALIWRHDFVLGAQISATGSRGVEGIQALLQHPVACLLGSLSLRYLELYVAQRLALDQDGALRDWEHEASDEEGNAWEYGIAPEPWGEAVARLDLRRLTALDFGGTPLGPDGAGHLAASTGIGDLCVLDLRYGQIGDAGAAALAGAPWLSGVTRLHLQSNEIGPVGAAALARSPYLSALTTLDLRGNPIHAEGAAALAAVPHFDRLAILRLHQDDVGLIGASSLASSRFLPRDLRRYWGALCSTPI